MKSPLVYSCLLIIFLGSASCLQSKTEKPEIVNGFLDLSSWDFHKNGTVKLTVKNDGDNVLIEVADTGIGIPQDELPNVFDEFYRATNARKVEKDGTGLGLTIAKQIIEDRV